MYHRKLLYGTLLMALLTSGCASVGGEVGAPTLAAEDLTMVPFDPSAPHFALIPKPVQLKNTSDSTLIPAGEYLTTMLVSALGRYENFRLYSSEAKNIRHSDAPVLTVQVLLTESDPSSTIDESGFDPWNYDDKWNYLWKPPISVAAFWISMITGLPTVFTTSEVKGVVGIEVIATNPKSGEIVTSFPVHATHIERAKQIGNKMFGASSSQEARSTFSGASRAALADAARLLFDKLKERYAQ